MARKVASFRLDVDLLDWVGVYAKTRGASQAVVIESALANLKREAEGGVPDLPVADTPEVRVERALKAAPVQRASSIETRRALNPMGWERQERIERQAAKRAAS
jgi:hypothetical protein